MSSQSDTEALKALVADATALQKQLDDGDGAYPQDYHDIFGKLEAALPALERMLASQGANENSVTLDKRDLFDFVRGEIKQALDEPVGLTESEAWEEAHHRTEDCLGKLYSAPPAEPDVEAALDAEVKVTLKGMVEALMYAEASLDAAQKKINLRGDLKGAGLMQVALDKVRNALKGKHSGQREGWVLVPSALTPEIKHVFGLCAKEKYPCAFNEMWEWALKAAAPDKGRL